MALDADEFTQVEVVVPNGANAVAVAARDHTWVALVQDGVELAREQSGAPETGFLASPGTYAIRSDGTIDRAEAVTSDLPADPLALVVGDDLLLLRLTADAPDQHVLDGIGELPADGESSCTITVEKIDASGNPLRRRRDADEIFLRTTGGTVVDAKGSTRIRSVKLRSGRATFRLVSEASPRLVTVSALGKGSLAPAEIQLEFV
jgi:hypothetical protein